MSQEDSEVTSGNKNSIPDYYQRLGISRTATLEEIKQAFRGGAKGCHPDTHPGDKEAEEKFKEINEAYQVLSDEEKKAAYDNLRRQAERARASGGRTFDKNSWLDIFDNLHTSWFGPDSLFFGKPIRNTNQSEDRRREKETEIEAAGKRGIDLGRMAGRMVFNQQGREEMRGILEKLNMRQRDLDMIDQGFADVRMGGEIRLHFPGREDDIGRRLQILRWARQRIGMGEWGDVVLLDLNSIDKAKGRAFLEAAERAWNDQQAMSGEEGDGRKQCWFLPLTKEEVEIERQQKLQESTRQGSRMAQEMWELGHAENTDKDIVEVRERLGKLGGWKARLGGEKWVDEQMKWVLECALASEHEASIPVRYKQEWEHLASRLKEGVRNKLCQYAEAKRLIEEWKGMNRVDCMNVPEEVDSEAFQASFRSNWEKLAQNEEPSK